MTERWWAPTVSGTAPDAVTLALLAPDGNAAGDLGAAVLAAHRAGAAALEHVAKSALPSEQGLVVAMADMRSQVAPKVVDAISPALGGAYAGLLVRDLLDDAEQGAVDLFRAAVAKGVSPPVAAQRAAASYGVPFAKMGLYTSVAADPKSNPLAIADAADRALMTYVSGIVATETDHVPAVSRDTLEPVSKDVQEVTTDAGWDARLHPRDTTSGEFVRGIPRELPPVTNAEPEPQLSAADRIRARLGLLTPAPSTVAGTPTAEPTAPRTPRRARKARTARPGGRLVPTASTAGAVSRVAPSRASTTSRPKAAQRAATAHALAITSAQQTKLAPSLAPTKSAGPTPEMLDAFPEAAGDQGFYDIGQSLVFALSEADAQQVRSKMNAQAGLQADPGARILRIGHLLKASSEVEKIGTLAAVDTRRGMAEAEVARHEDRDHYITPTVTYINHDELSGEPQPDADYVESRRREQFTKTIQVDGKPRQIVDHDEDAHVRALPVYTPPGEEDYDDYGRPSTDVAGSIALVHYHPADPEGADYRPMPTIDEFVIATDARGREEGSGRHTAHVLDKNQAYRLVNAPDVNPNRRVAPEVYWDAENEVVVNRWYLQPISEEDVEDILGAGGVGKALEPAQAMAFEMRVHRNELGEFAPTDERASTVSPSALPTRAPRQARKARRARTVRTSALTPAASSASLPVSAVSRVSAVSPSHAVSSATLAHTIKTSMGQRLASRLAHDPDLPYLSDTNAFKVLTEDQFQDLLDIVSPDEFAELHGGVPLALYHPTRQLFGEIGDVRAEKIGQQMARNVVNEITAQEASREVETIPVHGARPDYQAIAERVEAIFDQHPDADLVQLARHGDKIFVYVNKVSGSGQNIIEYDPELDLTKTVYLSYVGKYRARDIALRREKVYETIVDRMGSLGDDHEGAIPNPETNIYRLMSFPSPSVDRYRAHND